MYIVNKNNIYNDNLSNSKSLFINFLPESHAPAESLIHINESSAPYLYVMHNWNTGHFFLDSFLPFYMIWRRDKRKIYISCTYQFHIDFLKTLIDAEYLFFLDVDSCYQFKDFILVEDNELRTMKIYSDYLDVCEEIKETCFKNLGIVENRFLDVFFPRLDMHRKSILNLDYKLLIDSGVYIVRLDKISFHETLKILASAKSFTYVVGAGFFNLLFLNKDVNVLEINAHREYSWAALYGFSDLCKFKTFVTQNLVPSEHATGEHHNPMDAHINFDESLKSAILENILN